MDLEGITSEITVPPYRRQYESIELLIQMMSQEDLGSLRIQVYGSAQNDMWKQAEPIFHRYPGMVRIPLINSTGDTALHVAVSANSVSFVKGLLNIMSPQDLEIRNSDGDTAFCTAAASGNAAALKIMLHKNPNLAVISGRNSMLPVHLAVVNGHINIVQYLCSTTILLEQMNDMDIQQLFFMTIQKGMLDVAMKLFDHYPYLATARNTYENPTALHMLVRKPSKEFYRRGGENKEVVSKADLLLLKKLWSHIRQLEYQEMLDFITEPSPVLFDAIESGNVEAVKWILYMNRELLTIKHPENGRNLLHYAVQYRRSSLLFVMLQMSTVNPMLQEVNEDGDNILHLAALPQRDEASSRLRPNIQMRNELTWFKEVVRKVPPQLMRMRNKKGKTPYDVFYDEHEKLSKEIKVIAKGTAESGMVVATLVAAVAFASALTVPGDKTSAWFIVFILANAAALFSSFASILSFLSNITSSRFTDSKLVISLHTMSLITGPALLFVSVFAMVVSFTAASFLIFDHTSKWVAYVVTVMGFFPILLVLWFQDWGDLIQGIFHSKDELV